MTGLHVAQQLHHRAALLLVVVHSGIVQILLEKRVFLLIPGNIEINGGNVYVSKL